MSNEAEDLVRSFFAAFDEGDLDRACAMVSEGFELSDVASGQTLRGPAGCRQWLGTFRAALPDARTELVAVLVDAPFVLRGARR